MPSSVIDESMEKSDSSITEVLLLLLDCTLALPLSSVAEVWSRNGAPLKVSADLDSLTAGFVPFGLTGTTAFFTTGAGSFGL